MRKRRAVFIGIGLLIIIVGSYLCCGRETQGVSASSYVVKEAPLEKTVLAVGKISAVDRMVITSSISGQVVEVPVKVGDQVGAGQLLVQLKNVGLNKEVNLAKVEMAAKPEQLEKLAIGIEQAESKVEKSILKLRRYRELFNKGAVSRAQLEEAEMEVEDYRRSLRIAKSEHEAFKAQIQQANINLNDAEQRLSFTAMTAPVGGEVFTINVKKGDYVNVGTEVASIGKRNQVEITAEVNEVDSNKLMVGTEARVNVPAIQEECLVGKVVKIAPVTSTKSQDNSNRNSVEVVVAVESIGNKMRPGYSAEVTFIVGSRPHAITIPSESIVNMGDNGKTVWIIRAGKAYQKAIIIGLTNELNVEVVEGLVVGDRVITNPNDKLTDGITILPKDRDSK